MGTPPSDEPIIWRTDALIRIEFASGKYFELQDEHDARARHNTHRAVMTSFPVKREALTKSMRLKQAKNDHEFLPDFFRDLYPCMSSRYVKFLKNFDIGEAVFYPIDLYMSDGQTKRPDSYFIMNLRSQKRCWIPEKSRGDAAIRITEDHWLLGPCHPDWHVVVTADAAEGADLWYDPRLEGCLFFTDRLKRALAESSLRPRFKFYRCPVVPYATVP